MRIKLGSANNSDEALVLAHERVTEKRQNSLLDMPQKVRILFNFIDRVFYALFHTFSCLCASMIYFRFRAYTQSSLTILLIFSSFFNWYLGSYEHARIRNC